MNQPNPDRDFIGGIVLVPLLHLAFLIVWFGISALLTVLFPFFNRNYNVLLLMLPIAALGITQITYLIPVHRYFANKQRGEVSKGIILSAIITVLINGTCFIQMSGIANLGGLLLMAMGLAIAIMIGLIIHRRR
jgi:hypothetical protein